jgi:hypothetical protein
MQHGWNTDGESRSPFRTLNPANLGPQLRCSKIAETEAAVSVNEKKWLVMHMHVQLKLDELRGPPNPWLTVTLKVPGQLDLDLNCEGCQHHLCMVGDCYG